METGNVHLPIEHTCSIFDHVPEYEARNHCALPLEFEDYDSGYGNHNDHYGRTEDTDEDQLFADWSSDIPKDTDGDGYDCLLTISVNSSNTGQIKE